MTEFKGPEKIKAPPNDEELMPLLFLGHGSPMNAIEENDFVKGFRNIGKSIPKPNAILCISAHWETRGTFLIAGEKPVTIHDFGGFPKALYEVQYPAPGNPALAMETKQLLTKADAGLDTTRGFDHGSWSVIKHLYPDADVPLIQMSMDITRTPEDHYDLAGELAPLRKKGVLIIGSGNMVHNLGLVDWRKPDEGFEWAVAADEKFKKLIRNGEHGQLIDYQNLGKDALLSIPTPEHYLPLLYMLGLKRRDEEILFFNEYAVMGSLSMTSLKIGA